MPETSKQKFKHPNLRRLRNRPLCILCARPTEASEIAKALGCTDAIYGHDVSNVDDGYKFFLGSFKLHDGGDLEYYITSVKRQGVQSFTVDAGILFYILKPRYVVHAGVCAGYRDPNDTYRLKDVIMAEGALNYEEGKYESTDDGEVIFRGDFDKVTISAGDMQAFADSTKRRNYHYGDFITGSAVGRKAIGLDMEASAFFKLCQSSYFQHVHCLGVIKGISDFGDAQKGQDNEGAYDGALEAAAKALQDWVAHCIPVMSWKPSFHDEPATELVPGYYENFVTWILNALDFGMDTTSQDDPNFRVPAEKIMGFKIICPPSNDPTFYKQSSILLDIVKKEGITIVVVGGKIGRRELYYKSGYLLDFPRTVSDLVKHEDKVWQTQVFLTLLGRQPLFASPDPTKPAKVELWSWEKFQTWLQDEASKNTSMQTTLKQKPRLVSKASLAKLFRRGAVSPNANKSHTTSMTSSDSRVDVISKK